MRYSDVFGSCHPAVNFLYFVLVIAFSMCLTHPVCLLLSVCGAVIYHAVLLGPRSLRKSAVWMVPMAVLAAVINPAFTHQGVTILAYLPSGNPLTLESMLYGLASAALLSATLLWFTCYNAVMTSDKFIYLFGRVIPALSLVLSMTMRFVPRFRTQLHTVAQAQKYMGRDTENGSLLRRTKNAMKVFSIMVTWSLESAIETADSMKSRGYGEKGRTAFSIYRMDDRDRSLLAAQSLTPGIAAAEKTAAKGVSRAFVAGSYTLPTVEQADTQALQVALATNQFTGKGMTIAVLDTGLDTAHPAFTNASADAKFTKDYVSGILQAADLNAEALMPGVTADDVYLSAKIPFAFDYAGKDAQVAPGSKWDAANLEHGTHVAGISAGYAVDGEGAVTFSGVAPDAQVIPMKVFDDSGTGAATITILAALEDAGRLGVDAVNLSLGSYGGFTVDEDALINDVYNKLDAAGIMVITAAGNETSSSYMNSYGTDAPLTGDPDNSVVVAAPSVYPANLSIASVEGQEIYANYVLLGDEKNTYTDSQTSFLGLRPGKSHLQAGGH